MTQNAGSFIFPVFAAGTNGDLVIHASPGLLAAQEYLAATRQTIRQHVAAGPPQWRLTLRIEDTKPFVIDYGWLGQYAAAARIIRADVQCVLIVLAGCDEAIPIIKTLYETVATVAPQSLLAGAMDWFTGIAPPLAALVCPDVGPLGGWPGDRPIAKASHGDGAADFAKQFSSGAGLGAAVGSMQKLEAVGDIQGRHTVKAVCQCCGGG